MRCAGQTALHADCVGCPTWTRTKTNAFRERDAANYIIGQNKDTESRDAVLGFIRSEEVTAMLKRILLVGTEGFEPSTSSLSGMRSDQLSYAPEEKAVPIIAQGCFYVLYQLSYTSEMLATGLEPVTTSVQRK